MAEYSTWKQEDVEESKSSYFFRRDRPRSLIPFTGVTLGVGLFEIDDGQFDVVGQGGQGFMAEEVFDMV